MFISSYIFAVRQKDMSNRFLNKYCRSFLTENVLNLVKKKPWMSALLGLWDKMGSKISYSFRYLWYINVTKFLDPSSLRLTNEECDHFRDVGTIYR